MLRFTPGQIITAPVHIWMAVRTVCSLPLFALPRGVHTFQDGMQFFIGVCIRTENIVPRSCHH